MMLKKRKMFISSEWHSSSTIQLLQLAGQSHHGEVMPVIGDLYLKKDIKIIQARL